MLLYSVSDGLITNNRSQLDRLDWFSSLCKSQCCQKLCLGLILAKRTVSSGHLMIYFGWSDCDSNHRRDCAIAREITIEMMMMRTNEPYRPLLPSTAPLYKKWPTIMRAISIQYTKYTEFAVAPSRANGWARNGEILLFAHSNEFYYCHQLISPCH